MRRKAEEIDMDELIKLPVRYDANEMTIFDSDGRSLGYFTPDGSDIDAIGNQIADALNATRREDGCPDCGFELIVLDDDEMPTCYRCSAGQYRSLLDEANSRNIDATRREAALVEALERAYQFILRNQPPFDDAEAYPDSVETAKVIQTARAAYKGDKNNE